MTQDEKEKLKARIEVVAQGRLLVVKTHGEWPEQFCGRKRGNVETFTKSSRLRLLKLLARIEEPDSRGYRYKVSFLTLTTLRVHHPRTFKKFLSVFFKRLGRKFPTLSVVWRLEYQKRGAPHAHLILYNAPWMDKSWVRRVWGEIVNQDDPFTRIERIRSYKHLVSYASKYAAKVEACGFNYESYMTDENAFVPVEGRSLGRVWGVYNRNMLPMAEKGEAVLPNDGAWWLIRRYCQKFYSWIDEYSDCGFTVFVDDPYHALAHIVRLSESFGAVKYF